VASLLREPETGNRCEGPRVSVVADTVPHELRGSTEQLKGALHSEDNVEYPVEGVGWR
jgi:hypothetical protein